MGAPTPVMDGMNGHIPHPGMSTPPYGSPNPFDGWYEWTYTTPR